jgi:hypothetical protein
MKTSETVTKEDTLMDWLAENLGDESLGALTGTDKRFLRAAWSILVAWNKDDSDLALDAFAVCVRRIQPKNQQFAYHVIAQVGDWSSRPKVWALSGLPAVTHPWSCKHER